VGKAKYIEQIVVMPEDDANRAIVTGFRTHPSVNDRAIHILPIAGGWSKVRDEAADDEIPELMRRPHRIIVLLIDFDDKFEQRFENVKKRVRAGIGNEIKKKGVPAAEEEETLEQLNDRVFILGVLSNPEKLRTSVGKSHEEIGEALAGECFDNRNNFDITNLLWGHDLLKHNRRELERMINPVKRFLFNR
jgi:hypothetical protein